MKDTVFSVVSPILNKKQELHNLTSSYETKNQKKSKLSYHFLVSQGTHN